MKRLTWLFILSLLLLGLAVPLAAQEEGAVHLLYFYAQSCPHCRAAYESVIRPLQEEYGSRLDVMPVEIGSPEGYEAFVATEKALTGASGRWEIPTVVMGDKAYVGEEALKTLPDDVAAAMASGGVPWPDLPEVQALAEAHQSGPMGNPFVGGGGGLTPCSNDEAATGCEAPAPIHMLYLYKPGCQECERTRYDLRYIQQKYPQVVIEEHNVLEDAPLAEWLGQKYDVPESLRLVAPAVVVGDTYLVGDALTPDNLLAAVQRYAESGAPATWEDWSAEEGSRSIVNRFRSLGALTVAAAGLVDGFNPCAFATLIFFISYLTFMGRSGKDVLFVGGAFALGVFLTYLAVGVGLWKALSALPFLAQIGRWLYGLTALICAVFAVYSFLDFLKARRGKREEMTLQLPSSWRKKITTLIRKTKAENLVLSAFITGAVVSIIELACTGQVYLPTIIFVLSVPDLRAKGFLYLLLYNLLFITPLIVVFVLVYFGTTSLQLSKFLEKHTSTVKAVTALFFAVMAVWLVMMIV